MMKTTDTSDRRRNIVVIGNGMVGQRFCEQLIERDTDRRFRLVTFCQVVPQKERIFCAKPLCNMT